jgi:hypothetical protein
VREELAGRRGNKRRVRKRGPGLAETVSTPDRENAAMERREVSAFR